MENFVKDVLMFEIERPENFGAFHIGAIILVILFTVFLCKFYKEDDRRYKTLIGTMGIVLIILEIYKFVVFSINFEDGKATWDFPWYIFPWQFCSSPLYVFPLVGFLKEGKVRKAFQAFMSSYMVIAGTAVMAYPDSCFVRTLGVDIQTMMVHGTMVAFGLHSLITRKIEFNFKTIYKAITIFVIFLMIALVLNISFYQINQTDTFNMYFISPYYECSLPILSDIYKAAPYPIFLFTYIASFSFGAFLIIHLIDVIGRKNTKAIA